MNNVQVSYRSFPFFAIGCIISIILMYLLQLIIHEFGHYLFGLLTGHKLLSFRIGSLTLIKEELRYSFKKYSCPGSIGQCLMLPPNIQNEKGLGYKSRLYIMGGVIANFITAIIAAVIGVCLTELSAGLRIAFFLCAFYGIGNALMNGIPQKNGLINNDGTTFICIKKDELARSSYLLQLNIIADIMEGVTYRDFSEQTFKVIPGADLSNTLIGYNKILECYYFMDINQWDRAKDCIDEFTPIMGNLNPGIKNTVLLERLFIGITTGKTENEIDGLYSEVKKIVRKKTGDFHVIRVRMAYEIYKGYGNEKKTYDEIEELMEIYPYKGEAFFCATLIYEMLNKKAGAI